jgi:O-antigen ligase
MTQATISVREADMNPIEKMMTKRSTLLKVGLALVTLLLILWATGSTIGSIWLIPVIVLILWIAIQVALRLRHSHGGATR